ncbi:release factor glutamine methyltransferase [Pararhizobium capsulatum DSM 1112]|uniref:Release factor glutamine methyltransferase n=1 Tax=Pararhizobium capsulatum DSM 1112 TaxID=1121113 RepID=A0ABU0BVT0_9HYPH|nr:peptide chain release factor N(5)-glutamine methyltransferase [Pararhizobium capsulatum]MDQ0321560.1 release factor glutamine methyltransferase [Pararhizobium capsulatum DSM 1112]
MSDTRDSLLAEAKKRFLEAHIGEAALDARVLVSGLLELSATDLMLRGDAVVSPEDAQGVRAAIERRAAHEPVYRILGQREFYGLTLRMSAATLEPRPDSEMIVEGLVPFARRILAEKGECRVIDLGTGTGAICLGLLSAVEGATGVGTDISAAALETAQGNADSNGLGPRFRAVVSDWFDDVDGRFDIIVSNPPYIRSDVVLSLAPEVRDHDPAIALDGGADGLDAYRAIAAKALSHLNPDGIVGVEIGYDQLATVGAVFEKQGFVVLERIKDLGGNDRAIVFAAQ